MCSLLLGLVMIWFARASCCCRDWVSGVIVQQLQVLFFVVHARTKAVMAGQVNEEIGPGSFPVCLSDQPKETLTERFLQRAKVSISHLVASTTFRDQRLGLNAQLVVALAVEVH